MTSPPPHGPPPFAPPPRDPGHVGAPPPVAAQPPEIPPGGAGAGEADATSFDALTSLRSTDVALPLGGARTDMGMRLVDHRWFGFSLDRDVVRDRLAGELGSPTQEHGGMVVWRHAHGGGIERTVTIEGRRRGFGWGFDESRLRDEVVTVISVMVTGPPESSSVTPPPLPPPTPAPQPTPEPAQLRRLLEAPPEAVHYALHHLPGGPRLDVTVEWSGAFTYDDSVVPPVRGRLEASANTSLWSLVEAAVRHHVDQRIDPTRPPPPPPPPPAPGDVVPTVTVTWSDGTRLALSGRDESSARVVDRLAQLTA